MKTKSQVFSIPNILSFVRIAFIPFIIWSYLAGNEILSAVLIAISLLTDMLDGFIARKFNMVTPLGKALDPIADKLTLGVIILALCFKKQSLIILFVLFFLKELTMGIQGLVIIKRTGTTYSAKWYGKISTFLLYASMIILILWQDIPQLATYIIIAVCSISILIALVLYSILNYKKIKQVFVSI